MAVAGARSIARVAAVVLLALVSACTGQSGSSAPTTSASPSATATPTVGKDLPVTTPKLACGDLTTQRFTGLPDAATTLSSATVVAASGTAGYEYCDVKGTIKPQIGFELLLPTKTYRGRYLQEGCEGLCGIVGASAQPAASTGCAPVTDGSFAIGQDDEGHQSAGFGGTTEEWAADPQARIDFGYRSEHVLSTAAKAIAQTFYGAAPSYSYYDGCSDGGREALMEPQRYPGDFNGVLAGAPAFNQTALNGVEEAYLATIDFRADGSTILPATKVSMLHQAVIAKCADPTLNEQTIQDPRDCTFDPVGLRCPGAESATCLTDEQIGVVRKAYTGAVAPDGTHLYTGGEPYGSELKWEGLFVPEAGKDQTSTQMYGIGLSFLRWLAGSQPDPNATLDASLFTIDKLKAAQAAVSKIYDATDPDLSRFAGSGGKLIQYHGWADQNIPPVGTLAYRQAVIDKMGQPAVDGFYRLYMFPGMYHCDGGEGPSSFDLLSQLVAWTESGTPPGPVIASRTSGDAQGGGPSGGQLGGGAPTTTGSAVPSAGASASSTAGASASSSTSSTATASAATVEYTRPVYPYPQRVAYTGNGDVTDAANYAPSTPPARDDHFPWAGTFLTH